MPGPAFFALQSSLNVGPLQARFPTSDYQFSAHGAGECILL